MSKASTEALEELHGEIAKALSKSIKDGEANAAILNVARAFLKDNGIDAIASPGSPLRQLADDVTHYPFQPGDEADGFGPN